MAAILNVSMPEPMRLFVEDRASCGYGSISEYIRELIRFDQRRYLEILDAAVERKAANGKPTRAFERSDRPSGCTRPISLD